MLYVILAVLTTCAVYKLVSWCIHCHKCDVALAQLPTPEGAVPFFGHALKMMVGHPWSTFTNWAKGTHGTVRITILGARMVYTTNPAFIKRVLQSNQKNYPKALNETYKPFLCLLGNGLVSAEGDKWRKNRVMLSHAFRIDILDDIPGIALRAVQRMMQRFDDAGSSGVFDLTEEFQRLMLQIIAEAFISMAPDETDSTFAPRYLPIITECNRRVWAPWRTFLPLPAQFLLRKNLRELNSMISRLVDARYQQRQQENADCKRKKDMLDLCMENVKEYNAEMRDNLRDQVKTFLLAGHETSAAMMTWALYRMIKHPDICEQVRKEHQQVFEGPNPPTLDDLRNMKWAPAILREVLRLYSVVPMVPRVAACDDHVPPSETGCDAELHIPKGTVVFVHIDGVHNRPDIWEEPEEFRPSRFFDMTKVDPFTFLPFIAGPRSCLGQQLAILESSIVLSYLCWHFQFEFVRERDAKEGVHRHDFIIPLAPSDGLHVRAVRRQ